MLYARRVGSMQGARENDAKREKEEGGGTRSERPVAFCEQTLVRALTGVATGKFASEQRRHMTIKLGYANAKLFRCRHAPCDAFASAGDEAQAPPRCPRPTCGGAPMRLLRHVSLVDCPGHHELLTAVLAGAAAMDAVLLVAAANEAAPCAQTTEHLAAAECVGVLRRGAPQAAASDGRVAAAAAAAAAAGGNVVVVQTKAELCTPEELHEHKRQLDAFLAGVSPRHLRERQ